MLTYASYLQRKSNLTGTALVAGFANSSFEILAGTESVPVGEGTAAPTILSDGSREGRILIAAKVGTTRLIDNMEVPLRDACAPAGRLAEHAGDLA